MSGVDRRRTEWIAWLFMVGSALFAIGALPPFAAAVGPRWDALTFFVGSLFFTSAAFLQYVQAVQSPPTRAGGAHDRLPRWAPHDTNGTACAVQLAGTFWFNWSTGNALRSNLSVAAADQLIWRPDALGSIAFLLASGLAMQSVWKLRSGTGRRPALWWSAVANVVGSVAFGVSAVAAFVVPATGELRNVEISNLGTFLGALCFLVGAALLLVPTPTPTTQQAGASA